MQFPKEETAQRRRLCSLMNVRPPQPLSGEFLAAQDALLQAEREERGVVDGDALPARYVLHTVGPVIYGRVTRQDRAELASCYRSCLELVKDKDYFVLTINVDHQFQRAGFDKKRLFYTQGDYGLWQCMEPCHSKTYDNEESVRQMIVKQKERKVPSELAPRCPVRGRPMTMNLRADDTFIEDTGWHAAAERYAEFLRRHEGTRVVFLELGVGGNTPVIIKYPFWKMAAANPKALYACVNRDEAFTPRELE